MTRSTSRRTTVSRGPATTTARSSVFHRGNSARNRVEEEEAKAKARAEGKGFGPMRFFVPADGTQKEFIILDDAPDFFMYEHTIQNTATGKWNVNCGCIKEFDNCPVCEKYNESSYVMFLSVLDLTPFKDSKGVQHEFSRKLMAVKSAQQKKFLRKFEKDGTLRGALYTTARDRPKEAAIGSDIEFQEYVPEEELMEDYWRDWEDREGKKHEENCGEPFVYEEIFEEPTMESLQKLLGNSGGGSPGSRASNRRELEEEEDGWDDETKEDEWGEDDKPRRGGRSSRTAKAPTRGRTRREEPEEEEEEEDDAPRRGRAGRASKAAAPSRPRRGRPAERDEEEEEEEDLPPFDPEEEEEDDAPRRGRASRAGKPPARRAASRATSSRTRRGR